MILHFAFLSLIGLFGSGSAETSAWRPLPIWGGGFMQNVVFTSNRTVLYAYADVSGPYRSDDGGETWKALHGNMSSDLLARHASELQGLSVDPRDENDFVFCAGGNPWRPAGIVVSRDGGKSFSLRAVARFYGNGLRKMHGELLARDPQDPDRLLAASDWDGLWASEDNGEHWSSVGLDRHNFTHIWFDRARPHRVWACAPAYGASWHERRCRENGRVSLWTVPEKSRLAGLYVSEDGGRSWEKRGEDSPTEIRQVAGDVGVLGIFGSNEIRRSEDGGLTWLEFSQGLPQCREKGICLQRGLFYALGTGRDFWICGDTDGWIYRRNCGDDSWHVVPVASYRSSCPDQEPFMRDLRLWDRHLERPAFLSTLVVDPTDDERWFLTDWYVAAVTGDSGRNWRTSMKGISQVVPFVVSCDPFSEKNLIYGLADIGCYGSNDGGCSWQRRGDVGVNGVAWSPVTTNVALVCGGKGHANVWVTRDAGRSYAAVARNGMPGFRSGFNPYSVVAIPGRDEYLVAVGGEVGWGRGGVYSTSDFGESWTWRGEGLPTGKAVFKNDEFGPGGDQIVVSADGSALAVFVDGSVWRMDSATRIWSDTKYNIRCADAAVGGVLRGNVAADPFVPGRYLMTGANNLAHLWESTDGGRTFSMTWSAVGPLGSVAFDAHCRGRVVVGGRRAVYVSNDGGRHYSVLPYGETLPSGRPDFRVEVDRGRLFGYTLGSGVWYRNL